MYNEPNNDISPNNQNSLDNMNNNKNNFADKIKPSPYPSFNDTFTSTLVIKPIKPVAPVAPKPAINIPININIDNGNKNTNKPKQADFFNNNSSDLDDAFKDWLSVVGDSQPKTNLFDSVKKQLNDVKENFLLGENNKKQYYEGLASKFIEDNFSSNNSKQDGIKSAHEHFTNNLNILNDNVKKVIYDVKKNAKIERPQEACLIM